MNENLNVKVLESYVEIDKIHDDINNKIFNFITKANELVELSDDDYQIEKTLKLNKISLKGYVLDSDLCNQLNENNMNNYSIDELKNYFNQYESSSNTDYSNYLLALSLYELIENIETKVDSKIELEINELSNIIQNISDIKNTDKTNYENLYFNFKNQLDNCFKENKLDEKVIFMGVRDDIPDMMNLFDAFVFTSVFEGLGNVCIEAQSAGLPCFVSNAIQNEAIVSNHVWRYSLELSSREWAQQIEEILKTYERKDGRDQVIEAGYDVKNTAENLQRFYLEHSKK